MEKLDRLVEFAILNDFGTKYSALKEELEETLDTNEEDKYLAQKYRDLMSANSIVVKDNIILSELKAKFDKLTLCDECEQLNQVGTYGSKKMIDVSEKVKKGLK